MDDMDDLPTECCPDCGEPLDYIETQALGQRVPRRIPVRRCCAPSPTAAQMERSADDAWLAGQQRLATER